MKINMKSYEAWKENARKEKTEISKMDLMKVCGRIASAAMEQEDKDAGTIDASIEMVKIIDEFFPEKEEKEPDAKPVDLKQMLFNHAADSREPLLGTDVENNRTAEIRRDAKHAALISLILNAGLGGEYREWLRKKYE